MELLLKGTVSLSSKRSKEDWMLPRPYPIQSMYLIL